MPPKHSAQSASASKLSLTNYLKGIKNTPHTASAPTLPPAASTKKTIEACHRPIPESQGFESKSTVTSPQPPHLLDRRLNHNDRVPYVASLAVIRQLFTNPADKGPRP